jgi:hypothetical protein
LALRPPVRRALGAGDADTWGVVMRCGSRNPVDDGHRHERSRRSRTRRLVTDLSEEPQVCGRPERLIQCSEVKPPPLIRDVRSGNPPPDSGSTGSEICLCLPHGSARGRHLLTPWSGGCASRASPPDLRARTVLCTIRRGSPRPLRTSPGHSWKAPVPGSSARRGHIFPKRQQTRHRTCLGRSLGI